MTDRELLEKAAKAAGMPEGGQEGGPMSKGGVVFSGGGECIDWNPLTDDGDALRLAVDLGLVVDCSRPSAGEPFKPNHFQAQPAHSLAHLCVLGRQEANLAQSIPEVEPMNFIVSIVMTKHGCGVVNVQNKLYEVVAVSRDEARGKAIPLAQADFPEHTFHTACFWEIEDASAPQQAERVPLSDEATRDLVAASRKAAAWLQSTPLPVPTDLHDLMAFSVSRYDEAHGIGIKGGAA